MKLRPARFACFAFALSLLAGAASAQAPAPIPNAGDWGLLTALPGLKTPVCTVRTNGPEADTMIFLNNGHVPVLAIGRADWTGLIGPADVKLSVDGGPSRTLKGLMLNNLVLLLPPDTKLIDSLHDAKSLEWTLPFGAFRADVSGLGVAFDAMVACDGKLRAR